MTREVKKLRRYIQFLLLTVFIFFLIGCIEEEEKKGTDYETTKKIVVDILQTEDGKKAIQEAISDEEMKQELVIQSDIVKESINQLLDSNEGVEMWTHLFEDPAFVEGFVKSTEESQKKMMNQLMVDAEFQEKMLDLLQNPEIMKQTLKVVKSQQFREHLDKIVQENLNSPLFLAKVEETLLKAAEEIDEKSDKEQKNDKEDNEEESEQNDE